MTTSHTRTFRPAGTPTESPFYPNANYNENQSGPLQHDDDIPFDAADSRAYIPEKSISPNPFHTIDYVPGDDPQDGIFFPSSFHQRRYRISKWRSLRKCCSRPSLPYLFRFAFHSDGRSDGASCERFPTKRSKLSRIILISIFIVLAMLGLVQFLTLTLGAFVAFFPDEIDLVLDSWGQVGQPTGGLSHWPTDFTADVQPVQCHSHNDYWRKVPLYEAIHYGCVSVEADIWLFDQELYVGHTTSSLTPNRTLANMYINPLMEILDKQNPVTQFHPEDRSLNGVFDTDPEQTLILLVDFKTSGAELFPHVQRQLAPLRDRGYLTHWNGVDVVERPITIVGSGNTPFDLVAANTTYRDIFFDAPLDSLATDAPTTWLNPYEDPVVNPNEQSNPNTPISPSPSTFPANAGQGHSLANASAILPPYSPQNSYYASASFKNSIGYIWRSRLTSTQLEKLRSQIKGAHERGLKVRYWAVPSWPRGLRNHIWHVLIREGADMLDVDDLQGATMMDWRRGKGWWF